jgi:hypothetical protein
MGRALFVGAGASAEAGYPITARLTYPLADYIVNYRRHHRGETSRLYEYLGSIYCVEEAALERASEQWQQFLKSSVDGKLFPLETPTFLPSIIEIISMIDIALAEGWSFGPSRLARRGTGKGGRELVGNELRRVRERTIEALVIAFRRLRDVRDDELIKEFARQLNELDSVITTNWDILLDDALAACAALDAVIYSSIRS